MGDPLAAEIAATDYHTAGEPFRIVTAGVPPIPGAERPRAPRARERVRARSRRSADCCATSRAGTPTCTAASWCAPDDDGADLGVLFWHKDGYSTACGHGTIALGAWAVETGTVPAPRDGEVDVTIDVPSGRVVARVRMRGGTVESVAFRNVPVVRRRARRAGRGRGGRRVVRWRDLRLGPRLATGPARRPRRPVRAHRRRPRGQAGARGHRGRAPPRATSGCRASTARSSTRTSAPLHQRNVTIFADGEVDRSPCGSGTSARCALLAADGLLGDGRRPAPRLDRRLDVRRRAWSGRWPTASLTEVEGMAYRTGEHRFVLDPRDPLGTGFVLR